MFFLVKNGVHPQNLTIINKEYLCGFFWWASFVPQMKTSFKRFLLPICILLLGGFINLYADAYGDQVSPTECSIAHFDSADHTSITPQVFGTNKKLYAETEVEEQEEREEEAVSHDLHLQFGGYLTAFFYGFQSGIDKFEPNTTYDGYLPQFEGSPLRRHVRFQVFLI